ncbi:MAG TPA: hypothetical protein PKD08_00740 [Gudongella oleilytica]|nr:hypothetical protein [Gudongella oleilytica]
MYTFLILTGTASIVYGMRLIIKDERKRVNEKLKEDLAAPYEGDEDFEEFFQAELERIEEIPQALEKLEDDRRKLIEGLHRGEYSLEMVCSMLNMEKGEVLLLKNIYKSYQK